MSAVSPGFGSVLKETARDDTTSQLEPTARDDTTSQLEPIAR